MSEFENVRIVKKANIYFNGAVSSRTVIFNDGAKKTLGLMQPGEYTFTTAAPEVMEIMSGELAYRVGDAGEWKRVVGGESFEVPADSTFTMKVITLADYCCSFLAG